jgi:hypothetical protein
MNKMTLLIPHSKLFSIVGIASLLSAELAFSQNQAPISEKPDDRVNFPSNFQVEQGANLFIFGDYLYWIAHEDALYYAQTGVGSGTSAFPPNGNNDFKGHLKKVKPHWDNGLRIGLGLNFPKEGYDLQFSWTWFATDASNSEHVLEGNLLPLWAHPDSPSFAQAFFAKGTWHLDLNVGDIEWGRSSWFGGNFSFRPFFGIRGLWLDQDLTNQYTYHTTPQVRGHLRLDSDFRSGGLRAGAETRFTLPYGFSFYGLASGSLLYGRLNARMHFEEDEFTTAKTKDRPLTSISSLQLGLGASWDTHFCQDRCHIELHVGWEQNIWFGANQMHHFLNTLNSGDYFKEHSNLTLQGLVVGGRFDF